jgi:hypothetical protein
MIGYTKGPYAVEENPLNPERICRRLSSMFYAGPYMPPEEFRCFRVIAYCVTTWLIGLFTGAVAWFIRPADAVSTAKEGNRLPT